MLPPGRGLSWHVPHSLTMSSLNAGTSVRESVEMIRAAGNFGFKVYYGDGTRLGQGSVAMFAPGKDETGK